ncbi:MAG: hypothetical protein C0508_00280 [Cyanobacteria bacterium PR.023]|nr:hypothetical protein [Cyanobacteria bacterium PR.023]
MPQLEWRGKNTWKQVSTNVPPETLKVLRQVISKNKSNMSQLLRELIDESTVMKYGAVPQPLWASQLSENITALRSEIADLRAEVAAIQCPKLEPDGETLASELTSEIAQLRQEMIFVHAGTKAKLEEFEEQTSPTSIQPEVRKAGWPLFGGFTQLFQPKRPPVRANNREPNTDSEAPALLEVG